MCRSTGPVLAVGTPEAANPAQSGLDSEDNLNLYRILAIWLFPPENK